MEGSATSPQLLNTRLVSTNYFEALGVNPAIGRAFRLNETAVAVVSYAFWEQRLQGDVPCWVRS